MTRGAIYCTIFTFYNFEFEMSGSQAFLQYVIIDIMYIKCMACLVLIGLGLDLLSTKYIVQCIKIGFLIINYKSININYIYRS